ncbi:run domain Beclin-1-interacting and cysteine-rich domain-containing protein [Drosophila ficusphila]|uniref:run domain Beclin-1-interacting and cysteine-rich domain-containing protein n=1 Tax=Drosophila ficusphila TaxID=30025 RepID=UPI0007E714B3|nr:run domain Beclin-1-interacting and cysteine-rich domain-containing protein [Drosophila ficusphila]
MATPPPTFAVDVAEGAVDAAASDAVEHPQQLKQRQQQQQLARNSLLAELRRSTNFWFRAKSTDGVQFLAQSCTRILQHGLLQPVELQRLADDFEFLLASAGNQQPPSKPYPPYRPESARGSTPKVAGVEEFLGEWTTRCLRARCLSQCLQTLVSDPELMELYYPSEEAFLRRSSEATALFVCLTAVQLNQSGLLGQLEVRHQLRHRRTCSQPNFSISPKLQAVPEERLQKRSFIRRLKSLPNLGQEDEELEERTSSRRRCQTFSSSRSRRPTRQDYLDAPSTSSCSSSDSPRRIQLINCDDIKIWTDQTPPEMPQEMHQEGKRQETPKTNAATSVGSYLGSFFGSPPLYTSWFQRGVGEDLNASGDGGMLDTFLPVNGRKLKKQQTLFEGVSMLDEAATSSACVSSAPWDIQGSGGGGGSTTSTTASSSVSMTPGSDKMDQQSLASFLQMSRQTHNNTQLEKENAHFRISEACITAIEHVKWSRRLAKPPSGAASTNPSEPNLMPYVEQIPGGVQNHSAEAVGLQLISRFSEQQLPRLGHLKWLVSEQEAPQQLLPMPKPKHEDHEAASLTRGTASWAPPRQQIIFTEHPAENRTKVLLKQNNRCAGCGMRVAKHLQQHFRYCSYLGKYLCTGCHRNQISAIPAKILRSWDFRCYPVCSFAYRLIEQMYAFPLFHVPDLNGQLYRHKELARARRKRLQLQAVKGFIANCRFATREQSFFNAIPAHITQDPDMWSMCDFVDVQNTSMNRSIKEVIALSEQHVHNCVLCTGRAFLCEHCKGGELIYPWQRRVQRCDRCGACFHHGCWKTRSRCRSHLDPCPRCSRLQNRAS